MERIKPKTVEITIKTINRTKMTIKNKMLNITKFEIDDFRFMIDTKLTSNNPLTQSEIKNLKSEINILAVLLFLRFELPSCYKNEYLEHRV